MSDARPNLLFVMSDDHAAHAISAYGSRINTTPNLDRIADGGMRFDSVFCTNSICTPSRAAVLTGTYNHVNGVTTLDTYMDNTLWTFPRALQAAGYATGMFGKWHLGHGPAHDPTGFDEWRVLPGQGHYHNPLMLQPGPSPVVERGGYVTDLITDDCIDFLDRVGERPFALLCHHKAPHRNWEPSRKHFTMYDDVDIPEPDTFRDDLAGRADVIQAVKMRMMDLDPIVDLKSPVPAGLDEDAEISWRYQRYIKDYLRVVASIDDNVGRLLDYLDDHGLADNTIVVYTSDQGFFLGDHGLFDKRLMYEQSLTMPFLVRYPSLVGAGTVNDDIVVNVDFAPTFLELAGVEIPSHVQGRSFVPLLRGETPHDWPQSMYYRYWMHNDSSHACPAHYGVRTKTHKLICYYNDPLGQVGARGPANPMEWELFDLATDPLEVHNIHGEPGSAAVTAELGSELARLQAAVGDSPYHAVELREIGPDDWELFRLVRLRALEDAPDAFSTLLSEWQGDGDREERWRKRLDGVPFNLIAVVDARPAGQVSGTQVDDNGSVELISMWMAPEARRTGIGRVLVEALVLWAESSGARVVTLSVKHGNSPAIALYERAGFIDQGVRPDAPHERLMTRALTSDGAS